MKKLLLLILLAAGLCSCGIERDIQGHAITSRLIKREEQRRWVDGEWQTKWLVLTLLSDDGLRFVTVAPNVSPYKDDSIGTVRYWTIFSK